MKTIGHNFKILHLVIELDHEIINLEVDEGPNSSFEIEYAPGYFFGENDPAHLWTRDPDSDETIITITCRRVKTDDARITQFLPQVKENPFDPASS